MRNFEQLAIGILCLLSVNAVQGQQVKEGAFDATAPSIITTAIDPKEDDHYAMVISDGTILSSVDGGTTWNENHVEAMSAATSWLFSDKKGTLFGFGMTDDSFTAQSSSDQGTSWKPLGNFTFDNIEGLPTLNFHPDKGEVFLSYLKKTGCNLEVVFQQSKNGKKWTEPSTLNGKGFPCDEGAVSAADITIGFRGYVYGLWWQNNSIMFDRSFDGGSTWLRTDIPFKEELTGDFKYGRPALAADRSLGRLRGSLYAVWTQYTEDKMQVIAARSSNQGDYWSPSVPVTPSESVMYPVLKIDQTNGITYVAYWERIEPGLFDLYLAFSVDGAQTFKSIKMNSQTVKSSEELLPRSLSLSVNTNRIMLAWSSIEEGTRTYFAKVTSYGEVSVDSSED